MMNETEFLIAFNSAAGAYNAEAGGGSLNPWGYTHVETWEDEATGFKATAYKDASGNYVLAFAGTEDAQDWYQNLASFGWNQWAKTGQEIKSFFQEIRNDEAQELNSIQFTGHSLGGALAQYAAYDFVSGGIIGPDQASLTTFNALGGEAALTGDQAYGAEYNPDLLASANIHHYYDPSDLVSRLSTHVGGDSTNYQIRSSTDGIFTGDAHFMATIQGYIADGQLERGLQVSHPYFDIDEVAPALQLWNEVFVGWEGGETEANSVEAAARLGSMIAILPYVFLNGNAEDQWNELKVFLVNNLVETVLADEWGITSPEGKEALKVALDYSFQGLGEALSDGRIQILIQGGTNLTAAFADAYDWLVGDAEIEPSYKALSYSTLNYLVGATLSVDANGHFDEKISEERAREIFSFADKGDNKASFTQLMNFVAQLTGHDLTVNPEAEIALVNSIVENGIWLADFMVPADSYKGERLYNMVTEHAAIPTIIPDPLDARLVRYSIINHVPFILEGVSSEFIDPAILTDAKYALVEESAQYWNDRIEFFQQALFENANGEETLSGISKGEDKYYWDAEVGDLLVGENTNGQGGNSTLDKTEVSNVVFGGDTADSNIHGYDHDDYLYGRDGDDTLHGRAGRDRLEGNADNDTLHGGADTDYLYGGTGNDQLHGGTDNDFLYGGEGNDTYHYTTGDGNDNIRDVEGEDKISINGEIITTITQVIADSSTYKDNFGNIYSLDEFGEMVIAVSDENNSGTITLDQFNEVTNNFGLTVEGADVVEAPVLPTGLYEVGAGYFDGPNEDPDPFVYNNYHQRETYQRVLNEQGLTVDLTLITSLWDYDAAYDEIRNESFSPFYSHIGEEGYLQLYFDGTTFDDVLTGGGQGESLDGFLGDDIMYGHGGFDILVGGYGADSIYGGDQGDWIFGDGNNLYEDDGAVIESEIGKEVEHGGDVLFGEMGDDLISGEYGQDHIDGGDGADQIYGGGGDDQISGGNHADEIWGDSRIETSDSGFLSNDYKHAPTEGFSYNDILHGGEGDDILVGEIGHDILVGGEGSDKLHGDRTSLTSDAEDDLSGVYHGDDVLDGGAGDDSAKGGGGDDVVLGGAGADLLWGDHKELDGQYHGSDLLKGGEGNDQLIGGGADDVLWGGAGEDLLVGDAGYYSDGTVSVLTDDLHGSDEIHGGDAADQIIGGGAADLIYGDDGDDIIWGDSQVIDGSYRVSETYHGDDTIYGGAGNDSIKGDGGNDTIHGGTGADYLEGGQGNDTLEGGAGADYLDGGSGDDLYVFRVGDSQLSEIETRDTIVDGDGRDTIEISAIRGDISITINSLNGEVAVQYSDTDTVILESLNEIDTFKFNDALLTFGELYLDNGESVIDVANNEEGGFLYGGLLGDNLTSLAENSTFTGGTGDDNISSVGYGNTYVYRSHDGNDVITASSLDLDPEVPEPPLDNKISFENISSSSITLEQIDNDLRVRIDGQTEYVLVRNAFASGDISGAVSRIVFADGEEWDESQVMSNLLQLTTPNDDVILGTKFDNALFGGDGDDELYGMEGNDTLNGEAGNDQLIGGQGSDTYVFELGSGEDRIKLSENMDQDHVEFGAGLVFEDLKVSRDQTDLILEFVSSNDRLVLEDYLLGSYDDVPYVPNAYQNRVAFFLFSNGDSYSFEDVIGWLNVGTENDDLLYGSAVNDNIVGLQGEDTIWGGRGEDYIQGGSGKDSYHYSLGDGRDIYELQDGPVAKDQLYLHGILPENLILNLVGIYPTNPTDLKIIVRGEPDTLTINGYSEADGNKLHSIIFDNGTVWDMADIESNIVDTLKMTGTSGPDTIYGDVLNNPPVFDIRSDYIDGGAGNDFLWGGSGKDILYGGWGDDTLGGGAGDDVLQGGQNRDVMDGGFDSDTYIIGLGDDYNTILSSEYIGANPFEGRDTLIFEKGISSANVAVSQQGHDLVLKDETTDVTVVAQNYFNSYIPERPFLESIIFCDGTEWDFDYVKNALVDLTIYADDSGENIVGASGNDTLIGGSGHDQLEGSAGNDSLLGGAGDDILSGGQGKDTLNGGLGNDRYVYRAGDGYETIQSNDNDINSTEVLSLQGAIFEATTSVYRSFNDLYLKFEERPEDQVYVKDFFVGEVRGFTEVYFESEGTSWNYADVTSRAQDMAASEFDDTLFMYQAGTVAAGAGNDVVIGSSENDVLLGELGNDTLMGQGGNDILDGGLGDDLLRGRAGADTYLFGFGDGNDVIQQEQYYLGDANVIRFKTGISATDLDLSRVSNDLVIELLGGSDRLKVEGYFLSDGSITFDHFEFEDSADTLSGAYINESIQVLPASEYDDVITANADGADLIGLGGNDRLYGGSGDDTFDGGSGDDLIDDRAGNNIVYFGYGDGADTLFAASRDAGGQDTIQFKAGVKPSDVYLQRKGINLLIRLVGSDDVITSTYFYDPYSNWGVSSLRFDDGTHWTIEDIAERVLPYQENTAPTANDDGLASVSGDFNVAIADLLSNDTDSDGDALSLVSIQNAFGGTVSINYDTADIEFSVQPAFNDIAYWQYTVTDGSSLSTAWVSFDVAGNNTAPTIGAGLPSTVVLEDTLFNINILDDAFVDIDGDILNYTATLADGAELPNWLSFDGFSFSGTPTNDEVGSLFVEVTASDGQDSAAAAFELTIANTNDAPESTLALSDQTAYEGQAINFAIPDGSFADVDAADVLTYSATLSDGSELPTWLDFNAATQTFSGVPSALDLGVFNIDVQVSDLSGAMAYDSFTLGVLDVSDPSVSIVGTGSAELLEGTDSDDYISARGGADELFGYEGNDILIGGRGRDQLYGAGGNDHIAGGRGRDQLYGGAGNDTLKGGKGADHLYGGSGNDVYVGGRGDDTYHFEAGGGYDKIKNGSVDYASETDVLSLEGFASENDVWFTRTNNHLDIFLLGSEDQVRVKNWYKDDKFKIDEVELGARSIDTEGIESLVSAMASFGAPSGGSINLSSEDQQQVNSTIAAVWN